MKETISARLFAGTRGDNYNDWPSHNLKAAIDWFQNKLLLVPEEYRDKAELILDAYEYRDGTELKIWITYDRLETDAEEASRIALEEDRKKEDLLHAKALCEKYGLTMTVAPEDKHD